MKKYIAQSITTAIVLFISLSSKGQPTFFNYVNSLSNRVFINRSEGPVNPSVGVNPGIQSVTIFPSVASGNPMTNNLVAAWSFDEVVNSGARVDSAQAYSLTDSNSNVGSYRGLIGGAAWFTNDVNRFLLHDDNVDLGFGAGVSKTIAFWCLGSGGGTSSKVGEWTPSGGAYDYYADAAGNFQCRDLSGTAHQVQLVVPDNTTWHFIVIGYDNDNGVMFASSDGGAKVTLAISGIQKTGKAFVIGWITGGIDELAIWNRVLTSAEITSFYNAGYGLDYPYNIVKAGSNIATNFNWAVIKNGGAAPSSNTLYAVDNLATGMIADGTWSKCNYLLGFVPDNLIAARTWIKASYVISAGNAYLYNPLNEPTVSTSFIAGDLTVNGLTGNGSSKYLSLYNTVNSVNASMQWPNVNDGGFFLYGYTATSSAGLVELGVVDTGNSPTSGAYFQLNNAGSAIGVFGALSVSVSTNASTPGFFSVQRTSSTLLNLYYGASTFPHASISQSTSSSTASSLTRGQNMDLFSYNDAAGGGEGSSKSANTLSFFGINSSHLSAADDALVYARVQQFRVDLGGGFR